MYSVEVIERGLAQYIQQAILPKMQGGSVKGFALNVAGTLLIKRGGNLLRQYAANPTLRQMGIIDPDGAVDLDVLREAVLDSMPKTGITIEAPLGIVLRLNAEDVEEMYQLIQKEGNL